jgi:tetratricopeptide (TPR) repeat protein
VYEPARAAAQKALELDESLAEAHGALGCVHWFYDWDFPAAEQELLRALELNPGDAFAHMWNATYLAVMRLDFEKALAEVRRAQEIDPLSQLVGTCAAWHYGWAKDYDQSIQQAQRVLEMYPDSLQAHRAIAVAYLGKGLVRDALVEIEKAVAISDEPGSLGMQARVYGLAGETEKAKAVLATLLERSKREYVAPVAISWAYLGLSDPDAMFEWLEKAYEERAGALFWLRVIPKNDVYSDDPRFQDLMRRLNFPPPAQVRKSA